MLPISNPLLLAVNIEDVVPIVILIVSFLSWIFSAMKNNQEGAKNKKAAPKKRPKNFEDEMEQFLQQVNDPKAQERLERKKRRAAREKRRQQQQREAAEAGLEIEIIDEPVRSNRPQKSRSSKKNPQPVTQAKSSRLKESISSRTFETGNMGSVSKHVVEYLDKESEAKEARLKSLGQGVVQSVTSHMGDAEFYGTTAEATNSEARKIRQMLTGKESIRRAIVLNEVFSKPLSLRED